MLKDQNPISFFQSVKPEMPIKSKKVLAIQNVYINAICRVGKKSAILAFLVFFFVNISFGATYYSRQSGSWTARSTWSTSSNGTQVANGVFPLAGDIVIIERGFTVTVNNVGAACSSIQLGSTVNNTSSGTLTFAANTDLTVSGSISIGSSGRAGRTGSITFVNNSTLVANSITLGGAAGTPAAGTINMTAGGILITSRLAVNNVAGNTWTPGTGTVQLNANNTLPATIFTSFNNLIANSGTTTMGMSIVVNGLLTINTGTLAVGTNTLTLNGPAIAGTPANLTTTSSSNLVFGGSTVGITVPSSVAQLSNLSVSNANGISLTGPLSTGSLTFTSGVLNTTATNLLTITNAATGSIGGASAASYINGPMAWKLLANRTGNATYTFPVGDGANYRPLDLVNITTGATSPVVMVSESATGALNGDEASITGVAPCNWNVQSLSGDFTSAFVRLRVSGLDATKTIGQSTVQSGNYVSVGGTGIGATITTASAISNTTLPAYFAIGTTVVKTYYSYQSGDWNSASTWTMDASGTLWVNAAVPSAADNVVILNGRTVAINENTKSSRSLEIRLGGILDLQTYTGHNFGTVTGQGTLKLASGTFPDGTYTNFVAADGGTVEYYNCTGLISTTQTTYNNLNINLSSNTDIVYVMNNITMNGNFTVTKGVFRICDNSVANSDLRLIIDVKGNVSVSSDGSITVGTRATNTNFLPATFGTSPFTTGLPNAGFEGTALVPRYYDIYHKIYIGGDFTNYGIVKFVDPTIINTVPQPWFTQLTTRSAVTVRFYGASDNSLLCYNTTDFYNVIVEKGTDQTNIFSIDASQPQYFRLFGRNSEGGNTDTPANPELRKALWMKTGTTRLTGSVAIPTLSEGGTCHSGSYNNSDFYIPSNAALLVDGSNVVVLGTADTYKEVNACYGLAGGSDVAYGVDQNGCSSFSIYGKFQINDGYFSARQSGGFIFWSDANGTLIINGGKVDVKQLRSAGNGGGYSSYIQTGGTLNLIGRYKYNTAGIASINDIRNVATNFATSDGGPLGTTGTFNIDQDANSFILSGGTINIYDRCNSPVPPALPYAYEVNSLAINTEVTGGNVNFYTYTGETFYVNSGASFYNLSINQRTGTTGNVTWTGITKGGVTSRPNQPLTVLNTLTLGGSSVLNMSNLNSFIGKDFTMMNAASTYNPGANTTTFNGSGGQIFTNAGTITGPGLNNFVLSNTSNTNITNTLTVRGDLTINNGCFLNDQGNTISVAGNVTNSGTHTSTGVGSIILNGAVAQTIGSSGTGIFGNFTVNKAGGTSTFTANQSVTGDLRLVRGILNIDRYNLTLSGNSNIYDVAAGTPAPTTFGNAKMITTSGQQSDGGLTKAFNAIGSFIYPLGTGATYHPGTIAFSQAPTTWGDVTVRPIAKAHPFAIAGNQVLNYYWKVTSNLFTGIQPGSVSHTYHYIAADAGASEATYITGVYNPYSWTGGATAQVDKIGKNILFPSINTLNGEYTAGVPAAFGTVLVYYSRKDGNWDTQDTWSNISNSGPVATTFPGPDDPVVIGDGAGNNHVVTISANGKIVGGLQINSGSTLDIQTSTGHNFGALPDLKVSGTGKLRISSNGPTAVFPSGDFGNFLGPNGGTVEYYTQSAPDAVVMGAAFTLPTTYTSGAVTNITNYSNLILSPGLGKNITLPNTDLLVYKDFSTNVSGTSTTGVAQFNNQNNTRTLTINGNINVNNGTLQYINSNAATTQSVVLLGDLNILSGAIFNVAATNSAPSSLNIQGNLINNGTFDMRTGATTPCNVTFTGATNKQISGTTAVCTNFNILTVNKGVDRNSILEATVNAFSLNTALTTALTLTNGTFRLSTPLAITLTTTNAFTIPISGCLSANIGTINIGAANNNSGDLMLQGRLEVMNAGVVNIGNGGGSNNDIEYAAAGNPEINVSGGTLNVDGQIRRNTLNPLGSLWFNQSGGTITVKGNSFNSSRGMFEVVNTESKFNVSGGNLIIQRAGSVNYADVLITPDPGSSTVDNSNGGHTLTIGNTSTPAAQVFDLNISAPLWNLTVDGTTTTTPTNNNKTAGLSVNPLSVLNNLTINGSGSVFLANDLDVTIGGGLTNNNTSAATGVDKGGYQAGAAGSSQNTTFTGTGKITGTLTGAIIEPVANLTNFANLVIGSSSTSPLITLESNSNLQVNNNLTLTSGTLSDAGNTITVLGDIDNSATHTSPLASGGGIVLSNGSVQVLSGNGLGRYGNITCNNASGVNMTCNNMVTGQLSLSGGLLYIDDYKLTMDVNSSFNGTFDAKHMVKTNGVLSDAGVQKLFSGSITDFVFPIGSNGKYRPATYTITSPTAGYIKITPVEQSHPAANTPNNDQLNYYWKTAISGFNGLTNSTQVYQYGASDVAGNEGNYHGAFYEDFSWSDYGSSVINSALHTITINRSDLLAGEYTAGEPNNFTPLKPKLYSVGNGKWSEGATWSIYPSGIPAYGFAPNGNPVFIQAGHTITMDINNAYAYSVDIVGTLDLKTSSFHNLGSIIDTSHVGKGRMKLQATADGMFLFPGGNYDCFMVSPGTTVELYDVGAKNATMPLKPGNIYKPYQNLDLTGTGIKYMSAENLKVLGNLTINDGAKLNNTLYNKTLYILGNWIDKNTTTSGFVPGTGLTNFMGSSAQTLTVTNALTENYYNLQINNLSGVTLAGAGNVQVSNKLYLSSGAITTNSTNSLTITNSSTSAVIGGSLSSFVNGPLRKQISNGSFFTFPVGKSGTPSRYGNVYVSNVVKSGVWEGEYFNNDPSNNTPSLNHNSKLSPINHVSTNEFWRVKGDAEGSGNIQLRWDSNSGYSGTSPATRSKIRVVEWNPSVGLGQWEYRGKVLTDGGPNSGTVRTDNPISLVSGTDLHYLTIGDEGLPTATITSPLTASICNDGIASATITVALTGTPPWSLTYKLGAVSTTLNNIASSPVSIVLTSASQGIVQPIAVNKDFNFNITNITDLTGNAGTTDYVTTTVVTVKPIPSNTITGRTSVGTGEVVTYSTTADANTYTWTLPSGGTITSGAGTNSIIVTWGGAVGSYSLNLTKTPANGCSVTNSITVTTSTTPTPVITGSQKVCAGSVGNVYSTPNVASHSYTWSITPAGAGTITSGGSTNSCTVTWNSAASGNTVKVREYVTATPAVFTEATLPVDIGIQPSSAISYIAPVSVCNGSAASITLKNSENNVRYQLRLDPNTNDGTFVAGNGGDITLISSAISANSTYNIYAYTLAPYSCNAQLNNPAATFTINANSVPVVTNSATVSTCSGTGAGISLTATTPSNFTWLIGAITGSITGASAGSGSSINQILTNPSNVTSGTVQYLVTPTSTLGSCVGAQFAITITVNPLPVIPILKNVSVCAGDAPTISITNGVVGYTYLWSVTTTDYSILPAELNSVTPVLHTPTNDQLFPVGNTATESYPDVKVVVTDANGCQNSVSNNSTDKKITIHRIPRTGPPYHVGNNVAK